MCGVTREDRIINKCISGNEGMVPTGHVLRIDDSKAVKVVMEINLVGKRG